MNKLATLVLAVAFATALGCTTDVVTSPPPSTEPTPAPEGETGTETEDDLPPEGLEPYTEAEVQALFDERCSKCHDSTNALLDLSAPFTRETVGVATNAGQTKGFCASSEYTTRIVPGDREASLLWHKVKGTQDCGSPMPYDKGNQKLDATELERFGLWIDGLAKTE